MKCDVLNSKSDYKKRNLMVSRDGKKRMFLTVLLSLLISLTSLSKSHACTIQSFSYFAHGGYSVERMPLASFSIECHRILGFPLEPYKKKKTRSELYRYSVKADLETFEKAIAERPDAEAQITRYTAFRKELLNYALQELNSSTPHPFDTTPFEETLSELPAEFERYARGAIAYHQKDWDAAIAHFESLLDLPPTERANRSVWAAYMLGKSWSNLGDVKAIPYFEQTRELVQQGFEDPLDLADASLGWQARVEMQEGDYVTAIHRYAQKGRSEIVSLSWLCKKALSKNPVDPALVQDPLSRQLLTSWLVSYPYPRHREKHWGAALSAAQFDGVVEEADRLAWFSYNCGDWEKAKQWLEYSPQETQITQWVRSKLLLREGKLAEATALLEKMTESFPQTWRKNTYFKRVTPWLSEGSLVLGSVQPDSLLFYINNYVYDEIAMLELEQGNYEASVLRFLQAYNLEDATFLLERVLTPKEFQDFLEKESENPIVTSYCYYYNWECHDVQPFLKDLLARRWARMGEWEKAVSYYCKEKQKNGYNGCFLDSANRVKKHLAATKDMELPAHERAQHFFEVGQIIQNNGKGLLAPEILPSLSPVALSHTPPDLKGRLAESMKSYPFKKYFSFIAADFMWKAAELLPDNDPLTAKALFYGGSYIKHKYPKEADRFYKALVRRNPNLQIGQEADKLRWFPKRFTDRVLYHPYPKRDEPWYGRKLYLAIAAVPTAALMLPSGFLIWLRQKRKTALS